LVSAMVTVASVIGLAIAKRSQNGAGQPSRRDRT